MIKAIQTEYNGRIFRSRLEAKWAVFFDEVGVKWEYEPEGFELGDGIRYLPDFLLHSSSCDRGGGDLYIEVKGDLKDDDKIKIEKFPHPILVVGNIPNGYNWWDLFNDAKENAGDEYYFYNLQFVDEDYYHAIPAINKKGEFQLFGIDWEWDDYDLERTVKAYEKARNARFEKFSNEPITKQQYANNRADILESITEEQRNKLRSRKTWVGIPHSWKHFFESEDAEKLKRIIINILDYSETGIEPKFEDETEKAVFNSFLKPTLDRDFNDYCFKQCKS